MFSTLWRVCSSIIDAILTAFPSTVESNWKSMAHTTFGASASMNAGAEDSPAQLPYALSKPGAVHGITHRPTPS